MSRRRKQRKVAQKQGKPVSHKYTVTGRSTNQKEYIKSIEHNKVTFCLGPAGSGKTHIAASKGIIGLLTGQYERVIITRPMVQAGERTGFLPGDINKKLKPYIQPVLDELRTYISHDQIQQYIKSECIEVVPFAYMRGRNFNKCFIIADELQNASLSQLKLLLTRIGKESKMVITGDSSQSDLPEEKQGALEHYLGVLSEVNNVNVVYLTTDDIVREKVVSEMIEAMDRYDQEIGEFNGKAEKEASGHISPELRFSSNGNGHVEASHCFKPPEPAEPPRRS